MGLAVERQVRPGRPDLPRSNFNDRLSEKYRFIIGLDFHAPLTLLGSSEAMGGLPISRTIWEPRAGTWRSALYPKGPKLAIPIP